MEFRGMETSVVEVLRASELQRLRKVRQLGLAHLVFPGAEHSRLVHSIGASFLALRFAGQLLSTTKNVLSEAFQPDEEKMRDLALAALCHDLGHGPLSHLWEREIIVGGEDFNRKPWMVSLGLEDLAEGESSLNFSKLKWHELVAQALLAWPDGDLHKSLELLESGTSKRIRHMMAGEFYVPYFPRLLSSDVDVDRCDFILRDAHQTGVAYGLYDLNWLISTVTVGYTKDGKLVFGFDENKAPPVIEQFLIARRALYKTVYYHKTVRSAEGMIGLLFKRLKTVLKEKEWPFAKMSLFESYRRVAYGEAIGPREILGLDDYSLWVMIDEISKLDKFDKTLADLARRIVSRDLFKLVPCDGLKLKSRLSKDGHFRDALYDEIRPFCAGESEFYMHVDDVDFRMLTKGDDSAYFINLSDIERRATPIHDHPKFSHYLNEADYETRLFVPREAIDAVTRFINK
jgi:HD superfamily phosphohydrolase